MGCITDNAEVRLSCLLKNVKGKRKVLQKQYLDGPNNRHVINATFQRFTPRVSPLACYNPNITHN